MLTSWLHAARLRTLPLALAGSILGSLLAASNHQFSWTVFLLAAVTSLFLQILSNLANDYGDFTKGTDNDERIGPARMVSSGAITPKTMVIGIVIVALLALVSGIMLIYVGIKGKNMLLMFIYLLLGLAAIAAAIKYTVGKNPYGYSGFGDVFVFLFFGLLAVTGTYFLHTQHFSFDILLPATALGLLSTGVLNLNNLRDIQSDTNANKNTLVVMMGSRWGKRYHASLIILAIVAATVYVLIHFHHQPARLLYLVSVPFLLRNMVVVLRNTNPALLNDELRNLALSTLFFSLCFGIGLLC